MGKVDHHFGLAGAGCHALHPSWHWREPGQHSHRTLQIHPQRAQRPKHRQQIAGVEIADQVAAHRQPCLPFDHGERQAAIDIAQIAGLQARRAGHGGGPQVESGVSAVTRQRGTLRVVEVDHRSPQSGPSEQCAFGGPVSRHVAVVVEVVLGEVAELCDRDLRTGQAVLGQADRRGLDRAGGKAGVGHAAQSQLQRDRVGRGQAVVNQGRRRVLQRRLANPERADQAAALAQCGQRLRRPPGRAAFAVGASHSDHLHSAGGLAKPGRSQRAGRGLQACQAGNAGVVGIEVKSLGALGLYQAGRSAGGQRRTHVAAAVAGMAWPSDEGIAWPQQPAVGAQPVNARTAQALGQPSPGLGEA